MCLCVTVSTGVQTITFKINELRPRCAAYYTVSQNNDTDVAHYNFNALCRFLRHSVVHLNEIQWLRS